MKNIIFIAAPAAGKGTHSEILEKKYNYTHISTGDILREVATHDDEMGNYIRETLASGSLVKDEIVYKLLEDRLMQSDCDLGYILDGFPRNIEQAIKYDEILKNIGRDIGDVIVINVPENILRDRITGRRICRNCGSIFNINNPEMMPRENTICDNCGGEIYQRNDDNLDSFNNRYNSYLEKSKSLIDYYRKKGVLHEVDGGINKDTTEKEIEAIINND